MSFSIGSNKKGTALSDADIPTVTEDEYRALPRRRMAAVAFGLLILAIIAAIPIGTRMTFMRRYDALGQTFVGEKGSDGLTFGICTDLERIADAASNIAEIANTVDPQKYADMTDDVLQARDALRMAIGERSPKKCFEAMNALTGKTSALYLQLIADANIGAYSTKLEGQNAAIRSAVITIGNSGYNTEAAEYNRALDRFPASVIAPLCGVPHAEIFG